MEIAHSAHTVRTWTLRLPGGRTLALGGSPLGRPLGRPLVMGVLNLTPDSFSDGGLWARPPGGGVYGQGARTVPPDEEAGRLLPVLAALRRETDAPLSVDTRKGAVARQALAAGADLINDVAALADPELGAAVAAADCPLVLMHSRGELATMQTGIRFADVVGEVRAELALAMDRAAAAGIAAEQLILDPGIGFGKTAEQNLALIGRLGELAVLGRPLLLGASRKSFIAKAAESAGVPAPSPDQRLGGSLAAVAWGVSQSAAIVRVHDVAETAQLLAVWRAIQAAVETGGAGA
jgi:dihydropteroate synthase